MKVFFSAAEGSRKERVGWASTQGASMAALNVIKGGPQSPVGVSRFKALQARGAATETGAKRIHVAGMGGIQSSFLGSSADCPSISRHLPFLKPRATMQLH